MCTKYVQQRLKVEIILLLTFIFSHVMAMKRGSNIAYEEKTLSFKFTFPSFTSKCTTVRGQRFKIINNFIKHEWNLRKRNNLIWSLFNYHFFFKDLCSQYYTFTVRLKQVVNESYLIEN